MTSSAILPYPIEPIAELPIEDSLAKALLDSVAEHGAQLHGRRLWLACSGGRDSLVLAALCVQLYQQGVLSFLPQLLHVNHGLQADSGVWAQHVADWAAAQNIPCTILQAQVKGHDEQAARQARYDVMRAQLSQDDVLLLAHHADDQAETVLMRLIQGAGVNGLSGMQPWRVQQQGVHRIVLWRPWLTIKRANISAYAQHLKLPYIDDPTNEGGDNVRSGLRRDIMPILAKHNPNVIDNIARSAQLLSDAQLTISAQAAKDMHDSEVSSLCCAPAQRVLNIEVLQKRPIQRQRQLLHHWLGQDESLPPAKQLVDDVLNLSQRHDHDHQTELFWQGRKQSYTIRRYRKQLYRLSNNWLTWLKIPLTEQAQTLSKRSLFSDNLTNHQPDFLPLRSSQYFTWQVQVMPNVMAQLLNKDKGEVEITFAPLGRQQRIHTALASRTQAGKKLFQTLGVPVWLRDSLVVVSAVFAHKDELPLLLLSPFESWALGSDKSFIEIERNQLPEIITNHLVLHKTG
ncbi:tRNA lysidine(34) synthetase TilS [Psychrobacter sp. AOP22-C1-22]|uniref:tRNA lysidine(34) synthetase TilS n=1 Tax=unclassified Psychrobacter TaxID=196806 RepID=UPI0017886616|nr:tRNA lysidine(34) synthetase TilS [Psychrobacter sp. FME6]MBE0406769.1 tRNA lysidine(34) synthetase TilS [Psychrobacter sp. FME6]